MSTDDAGRKAVRQADADPASLAARSGGPMTLKDRVATLQSVVTIAAIIIGGFWTYGLFVKERANYCHANIEQRVSHVAVPGVADVLRVDIRVVNTGNTLLKLKDALFWVQQVLPLPSCAEGEPCAAAEIRQALTDGEMKSDRFSWPLLSIREKTFDVPFEIEPDETETFDIEFAVPPGIEVVRVYSYFQNESKSTEDRKMGWDTSTYYHLKASYQEVTE